MDSSGVIKVLWYAWGTPSSLDFRFMYSAEQLLSFHVYRVGGFLGDNKIIKAQDKITDM